METKCPFCSISSIGALAYLRHLRTFHPHRSDVKIACIDSHCDVVCGSVSIFRRQWYDFHHTKQQKKVEAEGQSPSPLEGINTPSTALSNSAPPCVTSSDCTPAETYSSSAGSSVVPASVPPAQPPNPQSQYELVPDVVEDEDSCSMISDSDGEDDTSDVRLRYDSDSDVNEFTVHSHTKSSATVEPCDTFTSDVKSPEAAAALPAGTDVKHAAAQFVLLMKARCGISQETVDTLITETESLIEKALKDYGDILEEKLREKNFVLSESVNLNEEEKKGSNIFNSVKTSFLQENYLKKKLNVIDPSHVPVISYFKQVKRGPKRKIVVCDEGAYHISLLEVLEQLIKHPDYDDLINSYQCDADPDLIDCFLKGKSAKLNPVILEHPDALRLILYYDDLEVCNPLGSSSGKLKLGVFYFFLENIGPKHRSQLHLICLGTIVNANLLKIENAHGLGLDSALQATFDDLNALENGHVLKSGKKLYGTLIAVIGDNLGSHFALGHNLGFTSLRPCRTCMVTIMQRKTMCREDESLLRTMDDRKSQLEEIMRAKTKKQREELMKKYGVKRDTLFSKLMSFCVIYGFPPDIMHDILEGVLPVELKNLLAHVIKEYELTAFWINDRVQSFNYGSTAQKPAVIKDAHLAPDGHLRQSASQMWQLAITLPFILGPYVVKGDAHWDNFMTLLEICRLVFAPTIRKYMVPYLQDLIEEYLSSFQKLYGLDTKATFPNPLSISDSDLWTTHKLLGHAC